MMDHVTQILCHPIYYMVKKVLNLTPNDCTDNQHLGAAYAASMMRENVKVQSIDVSAITDRFPLFIQLIVLRELLEMLGFKKDFVRQAIAGLRDLLGSSRSFKIIPFGSTISSIRYEVGQPMGTNISIPLAALSHHVLVRLAAYRAGLNAATFSSYRILGDDQVMANSKVAECYLTLLSELGMDYSKAKSYGLTGRLGTLSEFAKRLLFSISTQPLELSPLSPQLLSRGIYLAIFDLYRKNIGDTIQIDELIRGWCKTLLNDNQVTTLVRLAIMRIMLSLPMTVTVKGVHPRSELSHF